MAVQDLWYKNAILYCLDVETYMDANGDGIGDFEGLSRRLEYLAGLGVTCLWLQPFYPSPNRDNGYDITDYYGVHPQARLAGRLRGVHEPREGPGAPRDRRPGRQPHLRSTTPGSSPRAGRRVAVPRLVRLVRRAARRPRQGHGVPRHAEDDVDVRQGGAASGTSTGSTITSPISNTQQPGGARARSSRSWATGCSSACRASGWTRCRSSSSTRAPASRTTKDYDLLHEMRDFLQWRRRDAILLAEANVPPDESIEVLRGPGRPPADDAQLPGQPAALLRARHRRHRAAHAGAARTRAGRPYSAQWVHFLRSHDELDLGPAHRGAARRRSSRRSAPTKSMQLYDRGIRRRLAPMLGNDRRRLELAFSLLFSLPGTPMMQYGDEIGMGDDLALPERECARTPMQWTNEPHGGFSRAERTVPPGHRRRTSTATRRSTWPTSAATRSHC